MAYQKVFERYELKYIISTDQKNKIIKKIMAYVEPDIYGKTTIRNIYFDTDNYRLIRRSIEKPIYKEKLRIRSYNKAQDDSKVFVELKKKYKGVVYKRRISSSHKEAMEWLCNRIPPRKKNQITGEIDYFLDLYKGLKPKVLLTYDREAYFAKNEGSFRITFDENILFRNENVSLDSLPGGTRLLGDNEVLMELKCAGGIPLWIIKVLSEEGIYKQSFSKYGTAYKNYILSELKEKKNYV